MEANQYRLCEDVLRRLHDAGVLQDVVVVGSWCVLFYAAYFDSKSYTPTIRTRDLDLAIPLPPRISNKVDITQLMDALGFVIDFRGEQGYMRLLHPELILEFLVPERGRPSTKPYDIPALGINAQPLRFLDLSLTDTVTVDFRGLKVRLPHPVRFALHKLIVAERRDREKAERDRDQAILVLEAVQNAGCGHEVREVYAGLPAKWQRQIRKTLSGMAADHIVALVD